MWGVSQKKRDYCFKCLEWDRIQAHVFESVDRARQVVMSGVAVKGRVLSYVPGAPVRSSSKKAALGTKVLRRKGGFSGFHIDIMDRIIMLMVETNSATGVIMLSMVNRGLRSAIQGNAQLWYRLYLHWRGHYHPLVGPRFNGCRPLPNFRTKALSFT